MTSKRAKFVETGPAAILRCHLRAIEVTQSRTGLIEIWRAAKKSVTGRDLEAVIAACKARQAELLEKGIISL